MGQGTYETRNGVYHNNWTVIQARRMRWMTLKIMMQHTIYN